MDLKSFYKTADICQMMICKTEPEEPPLEEESPNKNKKKDPNKVDKKFLWPHGITPPLKNVRKRRFRKTLKKKYVEAPEIEKEVKRLLRVDNEAVKVTWEIIEEEADPNKPPLKQDDEHPGTSKQKHSKHRNSTTDDGVSHDGETQGTSRDVAEHDIFGAEVSDSDEEETNLKMIELDETSRLSADDSRSRLSDSNSMHFHHGSSEKMATEFSQSMFNSSADSPIHMQQGVDFYDRSEPDNDYENPSLSQDTRDIKTKIEELDQEVSELKTQRIQKELEISSIENQTLRKRLQDNLDSLSNQINEKEAEIQQLQSLLF